MNAWREKKTDFQLNTKPEIKGEFTVWQQKKHLISTIRAVVRRWFFEIQERLGGKHHKSIPKSWAIRKRTNANKSANIGGFNNDRNVLFIYKCFLILLYAAKSFVEMTRYLLPKMNSDGHDEVFLLSERVSQDSVENYFA